MIAEIGTIIGILGGFTFIQWVFNRKFEKRSLQLINLKMENELKTQSTSTNASQFELFEKMNDYLTKQFDKFASQDEKHKLEHKNLNKSMTEISVNQKKIYKDLKNMQQSQLRLQIMQLIDHSPELCAEIDKLYKEYKKNGGNSYLDVIFAKYKETQQKA